MSHSDQTDEEEIHRLRRLVKELLEKQDRMAGEIHDLKNQWAPTRHQSFKL